jgi:hypothetical protein
MHPRRLAQAFVLAGGLQPSLAFNFANGSIGASRGSVVPTFTRATTKTIVDWEGRIRSILASEVPFDGQRRVQNLLRNPEDITSGWTPNSAGLGTNPTVSKDYGGVAAPDGTFTAQRIQATLNGGGGSNANWSFVVGVVSANALAGKMSAFLRTTDGSAKTIFMRFSAGGLYNIDIDGTWRRYSLPETVATAAYHIGLRGGGNTPINGGGAFCSDNADFLIWHPQLEDVVGQSNINPSAYVNAEVPQGANVNGVRYFRTLNGNTVSSSNVVTEATGDPIPLTGKGFGRLPGIAGSYFSSPNAVKHQLTGNFDIDAVVNLNDYTLGTVQTLICKFTGGGTPAGYQLAVSTTGFARVVWADGLTSATATSSIAIPVTDLTSIGVRAQVTLDSGAGQYAVTFYTSQNGGATWVQLGAVQTGATVALTFSTAGIEIGSRNGGTAELWVGDVTRGRIYSGNRDSGGTKVFDFNADDWTAGGSFVSSETGETITLNGGAKINKWPVMGYKPDVAATNLRATERGLLYHLDRSWYSN